MKLSSKLFRHEMKTSFENEKIIIRNGAFIDVNNLSPAALWLLVKTPTTAVKLFRHEMKTSFENEKIIIRNGAFIDVNNLSPAAL